MGGGVFLITSLLFTKCRETTVKKKTNNKTPNVICTSTYKVQREIVNFTAAVSRGVGGLSLRISIDIF